MTIIEILLYIWLLFKFLSSSLHEESRDHKSTKAVIDANDRLCETPGVKFLLVNAPFNFKS